MPLDNLRNCHVVSSCLALSAIFLLLPLSASAQDSARGDATTAEVQASATLETERCGVDEDCDDSDVRATPGSAGDLDGDGFDDAVEQANYNNSRSNRANIVAPDGDTNVCDGVTCPDGSCAATADMCGDTATAADSVCNGYLCDSGECVTSEAMCGVVDEIEMAADSVCDGYLCDSGECVSEELWCDVDFDFEVDTATAADSVCNGYLCNDGTCASSEAMCGINFEDLPAAVAKCPANSPIRCGDGSCSAEVDRCLAIERQIDSPGRSAGANSGSGDGGLSDGAQPEIIDNERVQDNNSSRPGNAGGVTPRDTDDDGDGLDDGTEGAQNHNSSRSNRHNLRSVFSDTDADGRPEVTLRNGAFMPVDQASQGSADAAGDGVVCWGRAEDEEGKVYSWGRGICIAGTATANATTTAQARLAALQVRGDEVRGWTEEQQAAWREFRETRATTTAEERLVEQMVETTRANSRVQEIRSDEDGVGMQYRAEMRLFGLIPLERNVSAEVTTAGEVEVDYPWYRFLSRVPEQSTIRKILTDLQVVHGSGGGAGRVSI